MTNKLKTKKQTYIGLFITALLSISLLSPIQTANADVVSEEECFPAVLMLRGSGEERLPLNEITGQVRPYAPVSSPSTPYIQTNGYEGERIERLLKAFVNYTDPAETVSKVRFIGIDYPAAPVFPELVPLPDTSEMSPEQARIATNSVTSINAALWLKHIFDYNESFRAGATNVANFIRADEQRGCNTQYTIVGYSQGMMSARLALNLLNNETDKVISTYAIGDPFQKGELSPVDYELGDYSSRQRTAASEEIIVNSMIRDAAFFLGFDNVNPLVFLPAAAFYKEMTRSDNTIYRDDTTNNITSRFLCHSQDLACSSFIAGDGLDMEQHTNYFFGSANTPGYVDLQLEVPEFDQQVQTLANSTTANPRDRALTKTPSITGGTTSYNVANARPDDLCSWDEGSDGIQEASNIPCNIYNATTASTETTAKMTVTVTDSFGIDYTYGSEVATITPESIEELAETDYNDWYEYFTPPTAITGLQSQAINSSSVNLQWNPSNSNTGTPPDYKIYVQDSTTNEFTLLATQSGTSYTVKLPNRTQTAYNYKVVAVDYKGLESTPGVINFANPGSINPDINSATAFVTGTLKATGNTTTLRTATYSGDSMTYNNAGSAGLDSGELTITIYNTKTSIWTLGTDVVTDYQTAGWTLVQESPESIVFTHPAISNGQNIEMPAITWNAPIGSAKPVLGIMVSSDNDAVSGLGLSLS